MRRRREETLGEAAAQVFSRAWCGRCEEGWLEGKDGWSPCSCNGYAATQLGNHLAAEGKSREERGAEEERNRLASVDPSPAFLRNRTVVLETLRMSDDSATERNRQYWATNRLARILHDPKGEEWDSARWERFGREHPDPWAETERLEGPELASLLFRAATSRD